MGGCVSTRVGARVGIWVRRRAGGWAASGRAKGACVWPYRHMRQGCDTGPPTVSTPTPPHLRRVLRYNVQRLVLSVLSVVVVVLIIHNGTRAMDDMAELCVFATW